MKKIPKDNRRVHFLSTGPKFPYPYYLGIMTALKVYGKKVKLWITEEPEGKYYDLIKNKVEIDGVVRVHAMRKDLIDIYSYDGEIPQSGEVTIDDLDGTQVKVTKRISTSEIDTILEKEEPTNIELRRAVEILKK